MLLGALLGGFVNGLTGFGTALTAMPIWLLAVPPTVAAPLAAVCSVIGHVQTLPRMWRLIQWRRALPLIAGGLPGVPIGIAILPHVSLAAFKLGIGIVLTAYCSFMLLVRPTWRIEGGRLANTLVGLCSGVLGGLAGLSGPLPIVWASISGWAKDERRGVFLAFNGAILTASLVVGIGAGLGTRELLHAAVAALPGTMIGASIGGRIYARLSERRFDRLVLALLMLSGISMVWPALSRLLP